MAGYYTGTAQQDEWPVGTPGKLIAEAGKNLDTGSAIYHESLLEVYMPGFDHKSASDELFAVKVACLKRIRQDEAKMRGIR